MPRILLVDDDRELSAMLVEYLTPEGFEVGCAYEGSTGLQAALAGDYDAVVLDVMMPRLNGIEVLRQIRQHSQIPVLMLNHRS